MASCPPPTPEPCPQTCYTPPTPPCRVKPIMRGLHWAQTTRVLTQAVLISITAATLYVVGYLRPKMAKYADFYRKGEFEDWADEMARKGLFQSVPKESLQDNQHAKS